MDLIYQNPFRVLGLSIDASEREVAKRVSDMETYAELGKKVTYDTDFPFLAEIKRTPETIREAAHRIETIEGRFYHSLFWFWRNNSADELALDVLKEGNVNKAIQLLEKQFPETTILTKSYSSAKNLAVLYLASAGRNGSYDFEMLSQGLKWAGKVLSTSSLEEYAELVVGKTFVPERKKVTEPFIDEVIRTLVPHLDRPGGIALPQFIKQFHAFPEDTRRQVSARFAGQFIERIEGAINISKKDRKKAPENAAMSAEALYTAVIKDLTHLKAILPPSEIEYQTVADALAKELLQSSIDYFNYHHSGESGLDPGDSCLQLEKLAESIAVGVENKQLIKKNLEETQKWINGRITRARLRSVSNESNYIDRQIDNLPPSDSLADARIVVVPKLVDELLNNCMPKLDIIRDKLGESDDIFQEYSSRVADIAITLCVFYVNKSNNYSGIVESFKRISRFYMNDQVKERYINNNRILRGNISASQDSSSSYTWVWWVVGIGILLFFMNSGGSNKTSSYNPPTSAPRPAEAPRPPSLPEIEKPASVERKPPIGQGLILDGDQILYCQSEKIRLNAMQGIVDNYSQLEINILNNFIDDYNSRCSQYKYRAGALENARARVNANIDRLEAEGRRRILSQR